MRLSNREIEVVQMVASGLTAKEIAKLFDLEYRTIETYILNIKRKLSAKNIAHAVYIACEKSIIEFKK